MAVLSSEVIGVNLRDMPGWEVNDGRLQRTFSFANFVEAAGFVAKIVEPSEGMNHHPDVNLHGWNKVTVSLTTHDQNGITDADFDLARKIDGVA